MVQQILSLLSLPFFFLVTGIAMAGYALAVFFQLSTMGTFLLIMAVILISQGSTLLERALRRIPEIN